MVVYCDFKYTTGVINKQAFCFSSACRLLAGTHNGGKNATLCQQRQERKFNWKGFLSGDIWEVVTLIGEEETDLGMLITLVWKEETHFRKGITYAGEEKT